MFSGMLVGIIAAKVLSKTAFTGKPVPFVMELPNYRMPSLKSVLLLMWEKAWDFIRRAFTVIFAATIVIWFLQHFDVRLNVVGEGSTDSLLAIIGTWIAPVFAPLGFGDWRVATALLTGLMAKEAVISTLGVLMNVGANLGSAALGGLFHSALGRELPCVLPAVHALRGGSGGAQARAWQRSENGARHDLAVLRGMAGGLLRVCAYWGDFLKWRLL